MNDMTKLSAASDAAAANTLAILVGEKRPDLIRDEVLAEIFAATVAARPDHPALTDLERRLSYAEAWAAAGKQARGLQLAGIGPGDMVGLWMPRGIDLLVAQIAITRVGAAWIPFDAEAPVERIATCLNDADAKGIVTCTGWAGGPRQRSAPSGRPRASPPMPMELNRRRAPPG